MYIFVHVRITLTIYRKITLKSFQKNFNLPSGAIRVEPTKRISFAGRSSITISLPFLVEVSIEANGQAT